MTGDLSGLEKEQQILQALRKTLGKVVVDVTPDDRSLRSPLKAQTIEDIKMCFGLIAAREREILAQQNRKNTDRPQFIDDTSNDTNVLHFTPPIVTVDKSDESEKGVE